MKWATSQRLTDELANDGWTVVSVTYQADGHASIDLYRSDLFAAAKEGAR